MTEKAEEFFAGGFRKEGLKAAHWIYDNILKPRHVHEIDLDSLDTRDVDLRDHIVKHHSQGRIGSCVAFAVCKAIEIQNVMANGREAHRDLSRLAVYYLARELMFPVETHLDSGTYISHGCDVTRRFGVPFADDFPYDPDKVHKPPTFLSMRRAYKNKTKAFYRITSEGEDRVQDVILALHAGHPVVYGCDIGSEWRKYKKGQVLQPSEDDDGGHATCLVGFVDGVFIGANSWSRRWGDGGYYNASPELIGSGFADDFWVIDRD